MLTLQTMLLYLVGTVDRLPPASPLLKGTRLPVDSILEGAGLMAGQKSTPLALCPMAVFWAQQKFRAAKDRSQPTVVVPSSSTLPHLHHCGSKVSGRS